MARTSTRAAAAISLIAMLLSLLGCQSSDVPPQVAPSGGAPMAEIRREYRHNVECEADGPRRSVLHYDLDAQTAALTVGSDSGPSVIRSDRSVLFGRDLLDGHGAAGDWVATDIDIRDPGSRLLLKTRLTARTQGLLFEVEDPFYGAQDLIDEHPEQSSPIIDQLAMLHFTVGAGGVVEQTRLEVRGALPNEAISTTASRVAGNDAPLPPPPDSYVPVGQLDAWDVLAQSDDLIPACNPRGARQAVAASRRCVREMAGDLSVSDWIDRHGPIDLPALCA